VSSSDDWHSAVRRRRRITPEKAAREPTTAPLHVSHHSALPLAFQFVRKRVRAIELPQAFHHA
jgi:hypothetical protein